MEGSSLLPVVHSSFSAQGIQGSEDLRGHPDPASRVGSGDQAGEAERQARLRGGEPGDDLRAPAALLERPLQEVRGPDPHAMLDGEQEIRAALLQVLPQALHVMAVTHSGSWSTPSGLGKPLKSFARSTLTEPGTSIRRYRLPSGSSRRLQC